MGIFQGPILASKIFDGTMLKIPVTVHIINIIGYLIYIISHSSSIGLIPLMYWSRYGYASVIIQKFAAADLVIF